jgi:hypothetical protein
MVEGRPTSTPTPLPTPVPTYKPTLVPSPVPSSTPVPTVTSYPYSCSSLLLDGITESGTYTVYPNGPLGANYTVYCDMVVDGGGCAHLVL